MHTYRQQGIHPYLEIRHCMLNAVRDFFCRHGFLEVETPVRIAAPAPEAHIEAIEASGAWLQTSPEIYMKRLLASGYQKIFQICKTFRAHERGSRHLPEFTMLEWYCTDITYHDLMVQTENLILDVCRKVLGTTHIKRKGFKIEMETPWPRITVEEAFLRHAKTTPRQSLANDSFDEDMALKVEPGLDPGRPVFLYDYPAQRAALARLCPQNPDTAQRFEAYIGGLEICNGFTELTDPKEQRSRFEDELNRRRQNGLAVYPMPEVFLDALGSMPPAAGNALGIDRLAMLLAGTQTIDEVSAFVPEEQ